MGIRGELFSTRFACDSRTYFFNVKQNRNGDVFLSIVESKPSEGESFDRRSIVIFGEQMDGFLKSFQSALKYIDKTGIKVAPDPTAYNRADADEVERPRRSEESRPRRDSKAATKLVPPPSASTAEPIPAGERSSGQALPQAAQAPHLPGAALHQREVGLPPNRMSGAAGRIASSASKSQERSGKAPSTGSRGTEKPVKRIIVRKAKKSDAAD